MIERDELNSNDLKRAMQATRATTCPTVQGLVMEERELRMGVAGLTRGGEEVASKAWGRAMNWLSRARSGSTAGQVQVRCREACHVPAAADNGRTGTDTAAKAHGPRDRQCC